MEELRHHLYDLACRYAESEKKNIESVSQKKGMSVGDFIREYVFNGYSYLALNGQVDMKFLRYHLSKSEYRQLNPRMIGYFTKCINDQMERYFSCHQ